MNNHLAPSQPEYARTVADLIDPRSATSNAALQQIIQMSVQRNQAETGQAVPDGMGLLAQMLLQMKRKNCNYNVYPFTIPINSILQILPQNTERRGLIVSLVIGSQLGILLQQTQTTVTDLTTQPSEFTQYVNKSLLLANGSTPLTYDFQNVPSNPVTIVNNDTGTISGVVLEGT